MHINSKEIFSVVSLRHPDEEKETEISLIQNITFQVKRSIYIFSRLHKSILSCTVKILIANFLQNDIKDISFHSKLNQTNKCLGHVLQIPCLVDKFQVRKLKYRHERPALQITRSLASNLTLVFRSSQWLML